MNRDNLHKLADYLLSGKLRVKFDMARFTGHEFATEELQEDCGTAGCAIGHGPYAGIPKLQSEDWADYSQRVFGIKIISPEWRWLFAGVWCKIDNTPEGTGNRIRHFLLHGLPDNWKDQLGDYAELCY